MFSVPRFSVSVYVVFASFLFMALLSSPASAQTLTLAECTEAEFRQAVAQAPPGTTINFDGDCEITLTEEKSPGRVVGPSPFGEGDGPEAIIVDKNLTIDGGVHNVTISGNNEVGIFRNSGEPVARNSTLTLKNLTLTKGAGRNFRVQNGQGFGGGASGGGAVYNEAKLVVEGVSFIDNKAFDAGGAIYSVGAFAHVSVSDSTFERNKITCTGICSTHGGGGAIAALARGETRITDSEFIGNTVFGKDASGGAILARRSFRPTETGPVSISGSAFEENKALTVSVLDGRFRTGGGAVSIFNRELTIADSDFTKNEATSADSAGNPGVGFNLQAFGGAVLIEGDTPDANIPLKKATISDTTFTDNAATVRASFGGALFILRAPTSITRGTFTGNTAERTGAIDNAGANLEISESKIERNVALGTEGGLVGGGVTTQSSGARTIDGREFKAETTFTNTDLTDNVNGNCAVENDEKLIDNGGNSETPGASCGFNGAERVEGRPNARDDDFEAEAGTAEVRIPAPGVLANDTLPEGEHMDAKLVDEPRSGTVALQKDGSFVYTPGGAGVSSDAFTYRVESADGLKSSRVARVDISFTREIAVNSDADTAPADDGECTLREAVASANTNAPSGKEDGECAAGSGRDTIVFDLPEGAEITLGGSHIEIVSALVIDGSTAKDLTVSGDGKSRVFRVESGPAKINDLAITKGVVEEAPGEGGGGVFNSANLTLLNVVVSGNFSATDGGGVRNFSGRLTVKDSTITDNVARRNGGGISAAFGVTTVEGSTLSSNTTEEGAGGGLHSGVPDLPPSVDDSSTRVAVKNSTVSGNTSALGGGAMINIEGVAEIENSTITNNKIPGGNGSGVVSFAGHTRTEVSSSIIAANQNTDVDFVGGSNPFVSNGHNLIGGGNTTRDDEETPDHNENAFTKTGDQSGVEAPGLEELSDNGGPTETHALRAGSPAIDKGKTSLGTDQRGEGRPFDVPGVDAAEGGDSSDIGSFETQSLPAPPGGGGGSTPPNPKACTITGTPGNDRLVGTPGRDVICGLGGNDTIYGGGGNDVIRGGPGNDIIFGGSGNDVIFGDPGRDILRGGPGNDVLVGGPGRDRLLGQAGNDILNARDGVRGNDIVNGGPGRDRCITDPGDRRVACER